MSRRLHPYSIGVALSAIAPCWIHSMPVRAETDPHLPRPRSKGEKARNRKHKGH